MVKNPECIYTYYHPWQRVNVVPVSFDLQKKKKRTERKELPDKTRHWLVKLQTTDSKIDPNKSTKLDLTKRDFEHSRLISHSLSHFH